MRKPSPSNEWRRGLMLGTEILGILAVWLLGGYLSDKYFHTSPWGLLVGGIGGVGHVVWRLIKLSH
ncbi:MAG: AtpZ/AtpI family protein [Bacteroidia bacterium]|nr:AtpZ/AtpI family protein [Bacteroidia bacterium]MCX7764482.1 AtpZ/AtpI family protein [Bacteroidia bacterium]MDW8057939.1 AtpZ/AtpI family protein [Bacteroidia bacterium]